MILITGIILSIIFIIIPVCLGIQLFLADKSALKSFRNNLLPNQIVKIEFDNDIREARVIKATNSIVYVTLATGRKMAVLIEQVYPMNHFQDEQMPLEANNIKVA